MAWGRHQLDLEQLDRRILQQLAAWPGVFNDASRIRDCLGEGLPYGPHIDNVRRSLRKLRVHGYIERNLWGDVRLTASGLMASARIQDRPVPAGGMIPLQRYVPGGV